MPHIWLTYDELAVLMDCDAEAARTIAIALPLDRRRSRDGRTRAKLNAALTDIFIDRMSRVHAEQDSAERQAIMNSTTDVFVKQLRIAHARMAYFSTRSLPAPSSRQAEQG